MDLNNYSALELGQLIREKKISVKETLEAAFARIDACEEEYNSLITVCRESAYEQAVKIQEMIDNNQALSPIAGVPITIKDNICMRGTQTTAGSRILQGYISPYDATVVSRLKAAGAIIIGKTNMDEFAMGSTTESSYYGITRNALDAEYVPGGSSGGSAVSVKLGECLMSVGGDTGGSIRLPAAWNGLVGIKPTYGSVSRYGLITYGTSLDQMGPITKTVEDCAAYLAIMAGWDEKDSTSISREMYTRAYKVNDIEAFNDNDRHKSTWNFENEKCSYVKSRINNTAKENYRYMTSSLGNSIKGLRIAVIKEIMDMIGSDQIARMMKESIRQLESEGAVVEEISLPLTPYTIPVYSVIANCEASSNLARYDGVKYGYRSKDYDNLTEMYENTRREGFGPVVRGRIELGLGALSEEYYNDVYLQATKVRQLIKQEYLQALQKFDIIMAPTAIRNAPKIGEWVKDPSITGDIDIATLGPSLSGLPAINIPYGKDANGIPTGLQLSANYFREDLLFQVGKTLQDSMCVINRN